MSFRTKFVPTLDLTPSFELIQDQGDRPTCVAFAVTACHEYKRDDQPKQKLSEEFLYTCCKKIEKNDSEGTFAHIALESLIHFGQTTESIMPYKPTLVGSILSISINPQIHMDAQTRKISEWKEINLSFERIENELASGIPIIAIIEVQESFIFASETEGFIDEPGNKLYENMYHAIVIVGYGQADNGFPYFLIRNSWGNNWGQAGYGYMSYSYFKKFIAGAWAIC